MYTSRTSCAKESDIVGSYTSRCGNCKDEFVRRFCEIHDASCIGVGFSTVIFMLTTEHDEARSQLKADSARDGRPWPRRYPGIRKQFWCIILKGRMSYPIRNG